jgi:glycine/D-amino acid oxidase-like deaminating enzyme
VYLALTEACEHQLRLQAEKAKRYGMNFHEVNRTEAEKMHPLADFDGLRCIMYEPDGGNVDPSGVTHAYAAGARKMGVEIHRFTPVIGTEAQTDGSWIVRTDKGAIRTRWVINAAGLWAREVAAMGRPFRRSLTGYWPQECGLNRPGLAKAGDTVQEAILGKPHTARVLTSSAFDPDGKRIRG